ncbi:MAG: hypothetical protein Q4E03_00585 [Trueperella sp.]|nr:hypothetical protein [Trueperella sp.]
MFGRALIGVFLGAVAGLVGTIVHAGPVNMVGLGLAVAFALCGTGAWMAVEMGVASWIGYALGCYAVLIWLFFFPQNGDQLADTSSWASTAWLWGSILVITLPIFLLRVLSRRDKLEKLH